MKNSTHTVIVPVSKFVPAFVREETMECIVYSGSVTITGSCYLVGATDENSPYWECDSVTWILDGAGIEVGVAKEITSSTIRDNIVDFDYDVEMNPSVHSIVAGSPADDELRRRLAHIEDAYMIPHIEEAAQNNPQYLAFVAERREAKKRVADLRSQLAEAEYILRNPPKDVDPEGESERRHFAAVEDAQEARFDANREAWEDPRD